MELRISIANYRCFSDKEPAQFVLGPGLTAVVGANNVGKSALLRFFWELRALFEVLSNPETLPGSVGGTSAFNVPLSDSDQLFHDGGKGDLVISIAIDTPKDESEPYVDKCVIRIPRGSTRFTVELHVGSQVIDSIHHWNDRYPFDVNNVRLANPDVLLEGIRQLSRVRYIGPRRAVSSQATSYDYDGITGSNLVSRWRSIKGGGKAGRLAASRIERQLSELFGLDRLTITPSENGQDLIVSYGSQSYQIDELGSGLGHFVVAIVTLDANPETSWTLVDEPENGLHPSMQVDFLRTLLSHSGEGVVFATHNYGLARSIATRTYLVRREAPQQSSSLTTPNKIESLAEFLGELGYSGYRDLGVDRLLLVEGPNDVGVIDEFRRILRLRSTALVLPLGGSDAINKAADSQLAELTRICPRVYALIDSEKSSKSAGLDPVRQGFRVASKRLGITCHVLDRRAMENYFSEAAIRAVLGPTAPALAPYEVASGVIKGNQIKIASHMTAEEIGQTDVGKFLMDVFGDQT